MKYSMLLMSGITAAWLTAGSAPAGDYSENIGKTPPMGWNSWNCFHGKISSQIMREIADGAKKYKLDEAGYTYLVIDDTWQEKELGLNGELVASKTKFPEGIAPLVQYVKKRGFELGIYSCPNIRTCANFPGSLGHEKLHARQFVDWGCAFVKYDCCPTRNKETDVPPGEFIERFRVFGKALHAVDPTFIYALCDKGWGGGINKRQIRALKKAWPLSREEQIEGYRWCPDVGGVMWRTTGDISPKWSRIMDILDLQEGLEAIAGPNAFNDPDMLEVGNGKLTESENRAHFSLWCMLNAPLFLGNDLRDIPEHVLKIITNRELIALNQDLMCRQAKKVVDEGDIEYFVKPLANGDTAVCVLNRTGEAQNIPIEWAALGLQADTYSVRDLWAGNDLGAVKSGFSQSVASHDVFVIRLTPAE